MAPESSSERPDEKLQNRESELEAPQEGAREFLPSADQRAKRLERAADDARLAAEILNSVPTVTVQTDTPKNSPKAVGIIEQRKHSLVTEKLKSLYTLLVKAWRLFGHKRLPPMENYVQKLIPESPEMEALRLETQELSARRMRSEESEATFLQLLIRLTKAHDVLEVGTFTGYGTLAMAQALPDDGKVTTCDISEEWAAVGKKYWAKAEVERKIDLRIGQASETMRALLQAKGPGSFDLVFIDANKDGYDEYYELALRLVKQGGIVAIDNTLWGGLVADAWVNDRDTTSLRTLNQKIATDKRVSATIIPGWDGLTLAYKR